MIEEHMPWPWLLLGILQHSNGQATLQDIYGHIEEDYHEIKKGSTELIRPTLLKVDQRYGERPKYTHTVRGCLSNYVKRGLVKRVDRGVYQITDAGLNRLTWYQEHY